MGTSTHQPMVLVETSNLPREDWLAYRRKGIGGSDAAAVLGISPFLTGRDLYYDKLGISAAADDENWIAKEIGNRLEHLVAKIFSERTGLKVFQRKFMFQHPQHPWMLADLDYLVEMPDGSTAILECKTSTSNAAGHWWYAGKEVVPAYYESQGRHYMAVMDLNQVFFCCLLTDTHEVIIRRIDRDLAYEEELAALEESFWTEHVLAKSPPEYTENGDLVLKSVQRLLGPAATDAPPVVITPPQFGKVKQFLQLQEQKSEYDVKSKELEKEMNRLKALIVADMGSSCKALYEDAGGSYTITYNPVYKQSIPKTGLDRLKILYPEIYREFVQTSESRRFQIKKAVDNAA